MASQTVFEKDSLLGDGDDVVDGDDGVVGAFGACCHVGDATADVRRTQALIVG